MILWNHADVPFTVTCKSVKSGYRGTFIVCFKPIDAFFFQKNLRHIKCGGDFLLAVHIKNFDAVCKQYALLLIQILVEYTVYYGIFS